MPRSSRKRQPASALDDDVEMLDAENSSAKKPSASSPDPTQPSPSKRPRQGVRSRSASPRKGSQSRKKPPPKLKVNIKRFHGVARWSWNVGGAAARANEFGTADSGDEEEDDVCGICQNAFEGVAPGMKYPGDDCPLERGPCNHCFHLQCVNKWLSSKKTCPICRAEWPT